MELFAAVSVDIKVIDMRGSFERPFTSAAVSYRVSGCDNSFLAVSRSDEVGGSGHCLKEGSMERFYEAIVDVKQAREEDLPLKNSCCQEQQKTLM